MSAHKPRVVDDPSSPVGSGEDPDVARHAGRTIPVADLAEADEFTDIQPRPRYPG